MTSAPPLPSTPPAFRVLVLKTAALGDVLRTTSILPGLAARGEAEGRKLDLTWLTAEGAEPLLAGHPNINSVVGIALEDKQAVERVGEALSKVAWDQILSFDDEALLCELATTIDGGRGAISGAYLTREGLRAYTADVAPWFDMGLISIHGKERADELKTLNTRSHPELFASMVGVELGEPRLELSEEVLTRAQERLAGLTGPLIGLNTGAGGRWTSKSLPEDRVLGLAKHVDDALEVRPTFVLLGGPEERERHARLLMGLRAEVQVFDGTTENSLLEFAALIAGIDLLVTSDSLAMHMAIARKTPVVAFFAPTSAAEIELFGRGEKVQSTAADYCSYKRDADRSSLTVERLGAAVRQCLR